MTYRLSGSILEICDGAMLCPCWTGEERRRLLAHASPAAQLADV